MEGNRKQRRAAKASAPQQGGERRSRPLLPGVQSIQVRYRKEQLPELLSELGALLVTLRQANGFYAAAPSERAGPMQALAAVIDFLKSPALRNGGEARVLKALFDQLSDLDNGRVGPLVTQTSFGAGGSRPLATARWNARDIARQSG